MIVSTILAIKVIKRYFIQNKNHEFILHWGMSFLVITLVTNIVLFKSIFIENFYNEDWELLVNMLFSYAWWLHAYSLFLILYKNNKKQSKFFLWILLIVGIPFVQIIFPQHVFFQMIHTFLAILVVLFSYKFYEHGIFGNIFFAYLMMAGAETLSLINSKVLIGERLMVLSNLSQALMTVGIMYLLWEVVSYIKNSHINLNRFRDKEE
jgi:hypothetical protein